ncbi:MAG TPA: hypothetical protein DCX38_17465, partial [Pseudomonas sp.]|nr:hypothetical protein [Pseudomonas sp.]
PERLVELAGQWRATVRESAAIRRWVEGRFVGEDQSRIDGELVAACGDDWMPLARAMAEVMGHCDGFFPTDLYLYWRARELARSGVIRLSDVAEAEYSKVQVRRSS